MVYYLEWKSGQVCPFIKKDNRNHKGVFIILEDEIITAAMPRAFTYLSAIRNENQTFHITTNINWGAFILTYFLGFIFRVVPLYVAIEVFFFTLINVLKFLLEILQKSKAYLSKKFFKMKNNIECQLKQTGVKEYEIPRLQELYQIGYNMGHADGLAEGSKMGKSDCSHQT